ncbi:hypothetical protein GQ457_17G009730 [Hibiscus cannabinus]
MAALCLNGMPPKQGCLDEDKPATCLACVEEGSCMSHAAHVHGTCRGTPLLGVGQPPAGVGHFQLLLGPCGRASGSSSLMDMDVLTSPSMSRKTTTSNAKSPKEPEKIEKTPTSGTKRRKGKNHVEASPTEGGVGKRKKTSTAWDHFKPISGEKERVECIYCVAKISCSTANGTNAMKRHTNRCKKVPFNLDKKQTILDFESKTRCNADGTIETVSVPKLWRFDQEEIRQALAKMVVIDELPFNFVEREGFRAFCKVAIPDFVPPSRATITRDCYALFIERRKAIEKCLQEWGLKKILTLTVDNACSNHLAIKYLKQILNFWDGSVLNGEFLDMRCAAHILNLVVKDGLKDVDDSIMYVTGNTFVEQIYDIGYTIKYYVDDLQLSDGLRSMAHQMKLKFDKYWVNVNNLNVLMFISLVLDPRHKLRYVEWIIRRSYDPTNACVLCQRIKDVLKKLFDFYASTHPSSTQKTSFTGNPNSRGQTQGGEGEVRKLKGTNLRKDYVTEIESIDTFETMIELDRYLGDNCAWESDDFDILVWWSMQTNNYPILTRMTRNVLTIPVSTIASESAFSTGGRVLDSFGTSLTPKLVESLI